MATRQPTTGMAHPTVVPENFTPDDANEDDESRERASGGR
jgi:hypothetical protein